MIGDDEDAAGASPAPRQAQDRGASAGSADTTMSADPASYILPGRAVASSASAAPVRDPARYEIIGEHGRGGLGRVSRAHDKDFGRDIAIKELLARGHVNEVRFAREAMITARLEHPGIVPVYETGRWPDGTPFYAMKLISGRSLRALIAERTTVDDRIGLLHHVIAVADTIAYAHGRNVIHRDLKPANVIVGEFGETVVIDWGLAKDLTESGDLPRGSGGSQPSDDGLTSAGSVLGTPTYMAPEQERGEAVDQRADVFAIGAMLWELCSLQKVPPTDLAQRHRMLRKSGIDADLITIIDKALDPIAEHRYCDAGALAADLKAFKSGARIAAREYSLWAMLAHWTRRHMALATSVAAVIVFVIAGAVAFVRNIAVERDRADAALGAAQRERDRSKLSEAALLIDRDPNRAGQLLASFATRTPQVALLTSRAAQLSAARIVPLAGQMHGLFRLPGEEAVELRMQSGELQRFDPRNGTLTDLDRGLTDAFTFRRGELLYGRQRVDGSGVDIATSPRREAIGSVPSADEIVALADAIYVLDHAGDLRRLDGAASVIVDHEVRRIAGDGELLLVCHRNGELEVQREGAVVEHRRCAKTKSPLGLAVSGDDYAAVAGDGTLLVHRGGRSLELAAGLVGEYELALSTRGVVGIADYVAGGKTWFVRAGGTQLEAGPAHASQAYGVAVDGDMVAWGYEDGVVIVRDTVSGASWELDGHRGSVGYLLIDAARGRVISSTRLELRVWELNPVPSVLVARMPCTIFHVERSPDAARAALDCNDGSVWLWSRQTGAVSQIHKHMGYADGLRWFRGQICSGGFGDGKIFCSQPDGSELYRLDSDTLRAHSLTTTPNDDALFFASSDGKIWRFDRRLRVLYAHHGSYVSTAISENGHLLASCADDGSLMVFDLALERPTSSAFAHARDRCGVTWTGGELWSFGGEGTLKRWRLDHGVLRLQHMVQTSGALSLLKVRHGGWAAVASASVILVSQDGATVALRLDVGRPLTSIDVSADQRYVAASSNGEILVLDLERSAVATLATGAPVQQVTFLEPGLLAFSEPGALKTLQVDQLAYVPYVATPEPPNRASF